MKMTMKLAVATISGVLLFCSMNLAAEAASSRVVRDVTLKTAAAEPKAMSEGEKLEKAEQERIDKLLEKNPDDTYIIYVSKELKKNKNEQEVYFMGNFNPRFDTYEAYYKFASKLKEAVPQRPADLPKGYTLAEAIIISPLGPKDLVAMKAEAKKLGKQIHSKKINWTKSDFIVLTYTNGKNEIKLSSGAVKEKDKKEKNYVYKSAKDIEKENPNLAPAIKKITYKNQISWNESGKGFWISTNPENPLTKEDMIKLAKTMVKK
ncbi:MULTISPECIES: hypothetical protein [Paenibacillus]|uniref:Peptidase M56 BlaR1 n=1 Tax=Paenibacillus alvei TaxID=44250 RepID=A0ABT4E6P9_PAEAL|nr:MULTISPECIES: hypothetical protein [Paenibacillus]EPY13042.1 hypothetical protein PAAL66ix_09756 [Paenibacillus alvei A6-6i-x]MCY9528323.1 hypothetical protein [Paenibacillus alvei]SDE31704.1 hypothetical protein SAMN04488689_10173 [Paenibacillus sp. cl6col]